MGDAMPRLSYADQLKHPLWQRKRLEVFEAAEFTCQRCKSTDKQLHAHHKIYLRGRKPWEYPNELLECLCDDCHDQVHDELESLHLLIAQQPTSALPRIEEVLERYLASGEAPPGIGPRMRPFFDKLGIAMQCGSKTAYVDAQNELQDVVDESIDYDRGSRSCIHSS